jgi:hypothetical protein
MVFLENATDIEISYCRLEAVGGNGIFLSGYVTNSTLDYNDIGHVGDSCILAAGKTDSMDARRAEYPSDNSIMHNHLHNFGAWGKQTSCYFASFVQRHKVVGNVCYNGPRAGFNQNDGGPGGSEFAYNLIFNSKSRGLNSCHSDYLLGGARQVLFTSAPTLRNRPFS